MSRSESIGLAIRGIGWVTPLGNGLEEVWRRLGANECAGVAEFGESGAGRRQFYIPVPAKQVESVGRLPRIRRSSPITYFGVAAGLAALENAGVAASGGLESGLAARTAVIFAICSGGVNYTRRFYEKVVADGPSAASPILFPETVYNAPASHLAAVLGIDGASYTIVGDATVGLSALNFAAELLACDPGLEQCVVVGSEECDWILWEGYASWRLLASQPCVRLHEEAPAGMLLAEGAAALVVGRAGPPGGAGAVRSIRLETANGSFNRRTDAGQALETALSALPVSGSDFVIGSANGTWVDRVEAAALRRHLPDAPACYPKAFLGEPLGAGSLLQVALGAIALEKNGIPAPAGGLPAREGAAARKVAVTVVGLNQQVGAAVLTKG